MIIDGNKIAQKILAELQEQKTPRKELVAVLVGSDEASLSFLRQKAKAAKSLGVKFRLVKLSDSLSQKELEREVRYLSKKRATGGLLIQLPLPKQYDQISVLNAIGIAKDVDVLNGETTKILPPAVGALKRILEEVNFSLADKKAVVIGPGLLIGRPISNWLMHQVAKLTVIGKGGMDKALVKEADLVISGVGQPHLITADMIKSKAVIIDYGYGKENGELTGDCDFEDISQQSVVTPTPGGTGPVVVSQLLANFYQITN
ncbi:MAG: hypothetical protein COU10_01905 [Candidatus Harrisonbacteria bacterium CG10_big_fil_rev_8_21_14_0_10_45_28]|uniref:Methenyltetrahydrofolate cyclohydrolase n=1 Tax=Candidatus Harrisonbacteria bacterium CG10_big_fil_rev_8_21_14_0_10_45_28 TaxID=1974586 RepID=A0A2H0UNG8_9BACT|nr:MAG: hypothetical protein COU10_01905 [Candidatus Harrisonbacteria bacterium CG10_big_fil_rev_8_21_14_0_10_45_28]